MSKYFACQQGTETEANNEPKPEQTKLNQTKECRTTQQPVRTGNNKRASGSKKINTYSKERVQNKICQKYPVNNWVIFKQHTDCLNINYILYKNNYHHIYKNLRALVTLMYSRLTLPYN